MTIRVVLERGPKGKKSAAYALDWPGWSRGAKTADAALETLETYRDRYRPITVRAGLEREFDDAGAFDIVEDRVGPGSTDFWGISFAPCSLEPDPMNADELERKVGLLLACWAYFDEVAAGVSAEMRKGPRGGGRERDEIISHVIRVESQDFARKVGLVVPQNGALGAGLAPYRTEFVAAMRAYQSGEIKGAMRTWTLPYLIRHSAFHTLDHAWEMEDKNLSGFRAQPSRIRS